MSYFSLVTVHAHSLTALGRRVCPHRLEIPQARCDMQQGAPPVIRHVGVGAGANVGGEGLHVLVHDALDDIRLDRLGAVKEGGARGTQDVHAAAVAEPHRPDESVCPKEVQGVDVGLVLDQDPQDLLQGVPSRWYRYG